MAMKPLGVVINPQANRGRGALTGTKVLELLKSHGVPAIDLSAESALAAAGKTRGAITEQQLSGIIAVGGDGTSQLGVNLAIPAQLPFGLVPGGSGNDQARELNIPLDDVDAAVQNIVDSLESPRRVDAMRVVTQREFWSIGSISGGFDALCATRANGLKWPKGPNSYVAAMLLELPSFKPIEYELTVDGQRRSVKAMLCGVANVKNFGGGMKISPNSEMTDGELELFILHEVSRPKLLRIFPSVYGGDHLKYPEVEIVRAKSIRVENSGFPVTCDGELVGTAPFSAEVAPGALLVFSR
jgi:diacylglycerol kinase (ATP)